MKQFAIITPNGQYNYGNRLQNYAVTRLVSDAGGHAETLLLEESAAKLLLKRGLQGTNLWPLVLGLHQREQQIGLDCKRYRKFKAFTKSCIPTRCYGGSQIERLSERYDYFLIGSDQIWNPNQLARSCDFAHFAKPEQKVPIAPSIGVSQLTEAQETRMAAQLKTFQWLSVRESSGADIIKKLTGRDAQVLIDPTMMLDRNSWSAVSEKPKGVNVSIPFVLSYFLGGKNSEAQARINQYVKAAGAVEYPLLDKARPELYTAGPAEFLWLLEHAALICTDSFHAVVFSVLFDRPFAVFRRNGSGTGMEDRITTLLCTLRLEDRLPDSTRQHPDIFAHDYTESYRVLGRERAKFLQYLQSAIPDMNWEPR